MNNTQPPTPEHEGPHTQEPLQVEHSQAISDIRDAITALQTGQSRILEILEAPLREAEARKVQEAEDARALAKSIARGELRHISG